MLVGEGPGENEDATGLPFVGRAGKLLDDILAAVDLTRQKVYLTNTVKCRAAVEEGGRMKNRQPKTTRDPGLQPVPAGPDRGREARASSSASAAPPPRPS